MLPSATWNSWSHHNPVPKTGAVVGLHQWSASGRDGVPGALHPNGVDSQLLKCWLEAHGLRFLIEDYDDVYEVPALFSSFFFFFLTGRNGETAGCDDRVPGLPGLANRSQAFDDIKRPCDTESDGIQTSKPQERINTYLILLVHVAGDV